jgi:hypothetical protein
MYAYKFRSGYLYMYSTEGSFHRPHCPGWPPSNIFHVLLKPLEHRDGVYIGCGFGDKNEGQGKTRCQVHPPYNKSSGCAAVLRAAGVSGGQWSE